MTAWTMTADSKVIEASKADLRAAVKRALERCGCSFEDLAIQARTGRFDSLDARLAWVAIGDLQGVVDADAST